MRGLHSRRSAIRSALVLLFVSTAVSCASAPTDPTSSSECLGGGAEPGILAFSDAPVAEVDDAISAGFSDENCRYGFVSLRSNTDTARAVVLPAPGATTPPSGYFVASRGDLGPFIESLPAADPELAYRTMVGVIEASTSGPLDDAAEEAAAIEMAVLTTYGQDSVDTERPWVNERGRQLVDAAVAHPASLPRDIVLSIQGAVSRADVRLWVEPLERYLQGIDGYRTSVTVQYAGNSFDFAVDGPECLVLPRLTQDLPVSVIVVHHELIPAGTVLATAQSGAWTGGMLLVDALRSDSEFVVTTGGGSS